MLAYDTRRSDLFLFTQFADDTNALISNKCILQLRELALTELRCISKWLLANRIKANHSKTHFLVFKGRRKMDFSLRLLFEGKTLEQKQSSKMLGVIIDDKLRWMDHVSHINAKISRASGVIHKFSKILQTETLRLIYYSIIQPHLQYCNVVWGNASKSILAPLFRSQKKAIRRVNHAGYLDHTNNLFKDLKILKLKEINTLETAKFVKKEIDKQNPKYFQRRHVNHNMVLRNNNHLALNLPRPRSEREKQFITYHGPKIWNALPFDVQNSTNPTTFKIKFKKRLLNQY